MSLIRGLVACSDLTGYAKFAVKKSEEEIFKILSVYYEFIGDVVAPARGSVIKFMGDGALMFFPEDATDEGVRALFKIQADGDRFLAAHDCPCRHHVRAHFGPVYLGEIGTRDDKRTDMFGSTINTMFLLKAAGSAITPEAFRKLSPETRKLFKKHTPPITYIPLEQSHRDLVFARKHEERMQL
jgi:class 3 adenylate cyclase